VSVCVTALVSNAKISVLAIITQMRPTTSVSNAQMSAGSVTDRLLAIVSLAETIEFIAVTIKSYSTARPRVQLKNPTKSSKITMKTPIVQIKIQILLLMASIQKKTPGLSSYAPVWDVLYFLGCF
jgi:hypothetical protein